MVRALAAKYGVRVANWNPAPQTLFRGLDAGRRPRLTFAVSGTSERRDLARCGRLLLRRCGRAALATSLLGAPCASLVLVAADSDASPLLLLSDLAQHSRNIAFDPRVSLLFDGTPDGRETLSGPRLSLFGYAKERRDRRLLRRFAARHPESAAYADFADFRLYRVAVERGHLVMGFGQIRWLDGGELLFPGDAVAIAAAEPAILAAVNGTGRPTLATAVERRLGQKGDGWQAFACDPEGLDLRCGDGVARLEFAAPVATAGEALAALAELADRAGG
jgi:heme iron utilization protein